jgi:hypothetical protein
MLGTYVAPKKTPLDLSGAAAAMRLALASVLGEQPSAAALALALAKTALETGRWQSLWNGNWGNIKHADTRDGMFTCITLNEVLRENGRDVVVWFAPEGRLSANPAKGGRLVEAPRAVPPGHPQTRMRAFATASGGALDYVRFVSGGRYAEAWELLLAGDAAGYVHALKRRGYFTAPEEPYRRAVQSLQAEFTAKLAGATTMEEQPVPPVEVVREWLTAGDEAALDSGIAGLATLAAEDNLRGANRELAGHDYLQGDSEPPPLRNT